MGALSPTRRVGGPAENRIIFGSVRNRGKSCRLSDANSMTHVRARTPAEIRHLATRAAFPQHRSSKANTLCGQNSAGFLQICKTFKGIICDDISEFESFSNRGGLVSIAFRLLGRSDVGCHSQVLASLRDRHLGPPMMGSGGCGGPIYRGVLAIRLTAGIRTRNGLASSIVLRGHRSTGRRNSRFSCFYCAQLAVRYMSVTSVH